jgi:hypothetical protein
MILVVNSTQSSYIPHSLEGGEAVKVFEVNVVKEVEETGTVVCNRTNYRFLNVGFEVFVFEPEVRCLCLVCLKPLFPVKRNWRRQTKKTGKKKCFNKSNYGMLI